MVKKIRKTYSVISFNKKSVFLRQNKRSRSMVSAFNVLKQRLSLLGEIGSIESKVKLKILFPRTTLVDYCIIHLGRMEIWFFQSNFRSNYNFLASAEKLGQRNLRSSCKFCFLRKLLWTTVSCIIHLKRMEIWFFNTWIVEVSNFCIGIYGHNFFLGSEIT